MAVAVVAQLCGRGRHSFVVLSFVDQIKQPRTNNYISRDEPRGCFGMMEGGGQAFTLGNVKYVDSSLPSCIFTLDTSWVAHRFH